MLLMETIRRRKRSFEANAIAKCSNGFTDNLALLTIKVLVVIIIILIIIIIIIIIFIIFII